jgi:NADPH:quinone reductase-like Zn-dependent oxidoreductase
MWAIVQDRYGSPDDLELREITQPAIRDDEVLVRVHAASLHPDVWHVVRGVPYVLRIMGSGLRRPKDPVPGIDMAGRVESVGEKVTRFRPGDEVFGEIVRGIIQWRNGGAFAEYAAAPEAKLALKPANLTFEQAAAVPTSGLIAYQAVHRQGHVQPGQRVLINGAGGGVGTFAVQLAKAEGAEVTAVDSASKQDLLRSIGADRVIDFAKEDFTEGGGYDVIVDIPGNRSFADLRRALTRRGTYVYIGHGQFDRSHTRWFGGIGRFLRLALLTPFVSQDMNPRIAKVREEPMAVLKTLLESGKLTPAIDRTFPLPEVPEAIRYLETGDVRGKIVITV